MTIDERIIVLAKRILGPMRSFKLESVPPVGVEGAIGVYDVPGACPLWITTKALVKVGDQGAEILAYETMASVITPESKDAQDPKSRHLGLIQDDGTTMSLEVAGGVGRFCDSFEFARFLMRASALVRGESRR